MIATVARGRQTLRLFVALLIPQTVRREIAKVQAVLKELPPANAMRWTPPEQFHLTLKFLGAVPSPAVADLTAALARACAGVVPFRVTARGIGFFPHVRSPRVAWIGLESAGIILADLRQRVEQAAAPFGKRTESQKFAPHATLGRFKRMNRCDLKKFLDAVIPFRDRNFGEWQAREIFLMRSQLSSSGSRHVALSSFPLDAK